MCHVTVSCDHSDVSRHSTIDKGSAKLAEMSDVSNSGSEKVNSIFISDYAVIVIATSIINRGISMDWL